MTTDPKAQLAAADRALDDALDDAKAISGNRKAGDKPKHVASTLLLASPLVKAALAGWPAEPPPPQPPQPPPPQPPQPPPPPQPSQSWVASKGYDNPSALGWFSGITPMAGVGVAGQVDGLRQFRGGRPVDSMTLFQGGAQRSSWPETVACWKPGSAFQVGRDGPGIGKAGVRAILTVPFLNQGSAHQWDKAASGAFDQYYKQIAQYIASYGLPTPIILRPNREFNDTGQPFGAEPDRANGFRNFKAANERALRIFADVLGRGNLIITACVTKRGFQTLHDALWDPSLVDVIDCDLYKTKDEPADSDPANWTLYKRFIGQFVDFCSAIQRPLGFSEWGYHSQGGDAFAPVWFEQFFDWLDGNKVDVSHENYYNADNHVIYAPGGGQVDVPAGAKAYQQLWGSGRGQVYVNPEVPVA